MGDWTIYEQDTDDIFPSYMMARRLTRPAPGTVGPASLAVKEADSSLEESVEVREANSSPVVKETNKALVERLAVRRAALPPPTLSYKEVQDLPPVAAASVASATSALTTTGQTGTGDDKLKAETDDAAAGAAVSPQGCAGAPPVCFLRPLYFIRLHYMCIYMISLRETVCFLQTSVLLADTNVSI